MFIIPIYLFSEIFPGVSRGPICSSCTRAHSPVWPPLKVMAAYRRVYDSRHLQADCQEPGSAPEPYAR